jgi:Tfp pilus assembly PilM family ATPase
MQLTMPQLNVRRIAERLTEVPVVGLDVGRAAVKAARVSWRAGAIQLDGWAVRPIESHDVFGALRAALKQAKADTAHAVLGLASPELIVKPFQVPAIPKKELASAMQLEAEQCILNGHTPQEVVSDWHVLSTSNQSMRGVLAVVPKSLVAARTRLARSIGLQPICVDAEGLAAWNAYWSLVGRLQPARTVLLANVGAGSTNLVLVRGREEVLLVRDLQLGAEAIGHGQGGDWTGEVADSLAYAHAAGGLRGLDAVVLTGGGAPDALPLLPAVVNVPTSIWNPLEQVGPAGLPGEPPLPQGLQLTVAIGLALRAAS